MGWYFYTFFALALLGVLMELLAGNRNAVLWALSTATWVLVAGLK